jgi:hypothetical protein
MSCANKRGKAAANWGEVDAIALLADCQYKFDYTSQRIIDT